MISLTLSYLKQRPLQNPSWTKSAWLVLTQLLFFPLAVLVGVLYHGDATTRSPNPIGVAALDYVDYLSLGMAVFWVYRMKGLRWFTLSLVATIEVILFAVSFVCGMATSGDWL